jgi:hypothetical protein
LSDSLGLIGQWGSKQKWLWDSLTKLAANTSTLSIGYSTGKDNAGK